MKISVSNIYSYFYILERGYYNIIQGRGAQETLEIYLQFSFLFNFSMHSFYMKDNQYNCVYSLFFTCDNTNLMQI